MGRRRRIMMDIRGRAFWPCGVGNGAGTSAEKGGPQGCGELAGRGTGEGKEEDDVICGVCVCDFVIRKCGGKDLVYCTRLPDLCVSCPLVFCCFSVFPLLLCLFGSLGRC